MSLGVGVRQEDIESIAASIDQNLLQDARVLITGANGMLASYMVEALLRANDLGRSSTQITALVRSGARAHARFGALLDRNDIQLIEADVSQLPAELPQADLIIHAASPATPKQYSIDPIGVMKANFLGTHGLLERAREWHSREFLFVSSGEVYGQVSADQIPTPESAYGYIDIGNVRSCYAESKRAAETLGISFAHQHGVPFKIVRPFHTYGPGMALDDGRVFADFVADVLAARDIRLHSDGTAVRAFCYIADAIRAFFLVMAKGNSAEAYNVGNPDAALSIRELAELMTRLSADPLQVIYHTEARDPHYLPSAISINSPCVERLRALGWKADYSAEAGFRRTLHSFLEASHV